MQVKDDINYEKYMPRASKAALSISQVDLERLNKQLLTVLSRDVKQLMILSKQGKLSAVDSTSLTGYLKLIKELKKAEIEEMSDMSDEELKKLAKGESK